MNGWQLKLVNQVDSTTRLKIEHFPSAASRIGTPIKSWNQQRDSHLLLVPRRSALKKTSLLRLLPPAESPNKGDTGSIGDMSSLDWPTESRDVWVSLRSPKSGSTVTLLPLSCVRQVYSDYKHKILPKHYSFTRFNTLTGLFDFVTRNSAMLWKKSQITAFNGKNMNFTGSSTLFLHLSFLRSR